MKPKIYLYGTSGQYGNYLAALTEAGAEPVLSRDLFRAAAATGCCCPAAGTSGSRWRPRTAFLSGPLQTAAAPFWASAGGCRH